MKQPRAKGNRHRLELIRVLEGLGWRVAVVERTGRFVSPKDAFGLFDLFCIRKDNVLLVQCATNRPHPHQPFMDFAALCPLGVWVEQWVRNDYGGWTRHSYTAGGRMTTSVMRP
jgi:hypothetical protein